MSESRGNSGTLISDDYGGRFGTYKDAVTIYEDGKHRRYTLLFSVNGAVAAIAKIAPNSEIGHLGFWALAVGMILFTGLMLYDIWIFGMRLRRQVKEDERGKIADPVRRRQANQRTGVFSVHGRVVLIGSCLLIAIGWMALPIWGPATAHTDSLH